MKIPYQLVSMITILRDYLPYEYQEYRDDEHEKLSDIADSLYADIATPDQFKGEYQTLYKKYGPDYFAKVLEDMSAIDSQLTTDEKVDELYADYEDRLKSSMSINSTSKVHVTEDNSYANHLIKISYKDAKYALANLNKSHKTLGIYGEPGDAGYYVSEFEEATPGYMWASDNGLKILDGADIKYELVQKVVENSKQIKASDNPFYDKLSDRDKRFVKNTEKKMATEFSPNTFDVYNALLPYIGEYSSNTGWTGSCDLMKVEDDNTADGYRYNVIWDDGHDIDVFSWQINTNSRVGGDFTLMIMPAHGMPIFCDSEKDFYRAIRKVFGGGLRKIN